MAIYLHSALPDALRLGIAHQEFQGVRESRRSVELPCQNNFSNRRVSNSGGSNRFKPPNPSAKGSDSAASGGAAPGSPPDTWRRLMPTTSSPPGLGQFRPPSLPSKSKGYNHAACQPTYFFVRYRRANFSSRAWMSDEDRCVQSTLSKMMHHGMIMVTEVFKWLHLHIVHLINS